MSYSETWYRGVSRNFLQFVYGYAYKGMEPDPEQWIIYTPFKPGRNPSIAHRIYNQTLSQSTGRVDTNGKLLFVGDFVRTRYGRICEIIKESTNYYCGFNLRPRDGFEPILNPEDMWNAEYLEYVGNIYDAFIQEQKTIQNQSL